MGCYIVRKSVRKTTGINIICELDHGSESSRKKALARSQLIINWIMDHLCQYTEKQKRNLFSVFFWPDLNLSLTQDFSIECKICHTAYKF